MPILTSSWDLELMQVRAESDEIRRNVHGHEPGEEVDDLGLVVELGSQSREWEEQEVIIRDFGELAASLALS